MDNNLKKFIRNGYYDTPQFLQVEITDYCPLACPQCYKKETNWSFIDFERFINIVNEAEKIGVKSITLNGGEPVLHPNFVEFVKECNKRKIECAVITSGYGVDDKFCENIRKLKITIHISLNGSTEKINEYSRDGYDISIRAIKLLHKNNIPYIINWVARHDNVGDLENLIQLCKENGANSVNIVCNKIAASDIAKSECNLDDYKKLKETITKNSDYIKIQNCYGVLMGYLGYIHGNNRLYGCQAAIRLMGVNVHGQYMPCTHLYYFENADSLMDYWRNSKMLNLIRKLGKLKFCGECNKCRVCHAITEETYQNMTLGYKNCPIKSE